jgi:hypothetical protein
MAATGSKSIDTDSTVIQEIKRLHDEIIACVRIGLANAIHIGQLLTKQKEKVGHGACGGIGLELTCPSLTALRATI